MHYEYEDQINYSTYKDFKLSTDREYENTSQMTNDELDQIIRLIPHASPRQTLVIEGQIEIHKQLTKTKE